MMRTYKCIESNLFTPMLTEHGYSIRVTIHIIKLIKSNNFLQILYSYGLECLNILILHYESTSEYEVCQAIKDVIDNHNKSTGTHLKLK